MIDGLIPITDEQAKLGQELVKAFRDVGSFFGKALGSTPEDLIGYFGGDRLRIRRVENMARMMYQAKERLLERGVEQTKPATLSIALPLLEGAADEDREELVDLWARLLASSMNPATRHYVRHAFIAAVKDMDPTDAKVLHHIHSHDVTGIRRGGGPNVDDAKNTSIDIVSQHLGCRQDDVLVSVEHLIELGFLVPSPTDRNIWFPTAKFEGIYAGVLPRTMIGSGRPNAERVSRTTSVNTTWDSTRRTICRPGPSGLARPLGSLRGWRSSRRPGSRG